MRKLLLACMVAWPMVGNAQTNDVYWGPWNSNEERFSAKIEGLGGAGVAYSDDSAAAVANPALLASLTRSEIVGGVNTRPKTQFGVIGGGGVLKQGIALGGYVHRPGIIEETVAGDGTSKYELTEGAGIAAFQFGKIALGGAIRVSRLSFTGLATTTEAGLPLLSGSEAGSTRVGGTLGLAYVSSGFTLGVSYRLKDTYEATRTSQYDRLTDDAGSTYDVVRPGKLFAGFGYRWGAKGGIFGQVDYREAGSLLLVAHRGARGATWAAEESGLAAARGGIEYAFPAGGISIVLRGGVRYTAEAGITSTGDDEYFPGTASETSPTGGVSLVFKGGSVDVGGSKGGVAVEGRVRF